MYMGEEVTVDFTEGTYLVQVQVHINVMWERWSQLIAHQQVINRH